MDQPEHHDIARHCRPSFWPPDQKNHLKRTAFGKNTHYSIYIKPLLAYSVNYSINIDITEKEPIKIKPMMIEAFS
jgi:hypothetical protein